MRQLETYPCRFPLFARTAPQLRRSASLGVECNPPACSSRTAGAHWRMFSEFAAIASMCVLMMRQGTAPQGDSSSDQFHLLRKTVRLPRCLATRAAVYPDQQHGRAVNEFRATNSNGMSNCACRAEPRGIRFGICFISEQLSCMVRGLKSRPREHSDIWRASGSC